MGKKLISFINFRDVELQVCYEYTPAYYSSDRDVPNEPAEVLIDGAYVKGENIDNLIEELFPEIEEQLLEYLENKSFKDER